MKLAVHSITGKETSKKVDLSTVNYPHSLGVFYTTGDFVVEAQGSYIFQKHQDMYGNNA